MNKDQKYKLYKSALLLSIFTIIFNLFEGLASVYFGYKDETLTLFGFGADSFIEMISAAGIFIMVKRISFYLLSIGLLFSVLVNVYNGNKPKTAIAGVIIALISIAAMASLIYGKQYFGKKLNSAPIIADANCTRVCVYMSLVLLISSLIYEMTGFGYIDSLGTIGIIYLSVKEGKEAFEKARGTDTCNC